MIGAVAGATHARSMRFGGGGFGGFEDDTSKQQCIFGVVAVVGFGLLITGLYYTIISTTDYRAELVDPYNIDVKNWTELYSVQMRNSTFEFRVLPSNETAGTGFIQMESSEAPETMKWERGHADLASYTPFRFVEQGLPNLNLTYDDSRDVFLEFEVRACYLASCNNFMIPPIGIEHRQIHYLNQKMCHNHRGFMFKGVCVVLQVLLSACIQVELQNTAWIMPPEHNGGCTPSSNWSVPNYGLASSNVQFNMDTFSLTVRSSHDPSVVAQDLTNGQMFFGNSSHDNLVTGVICLVLGTLMCIPCSVHTCQRVVEIRRLKKYTHVERRPSASSSPDLHVVYREDTVLEDGYAHSQGSRLAIRSSGGRDVEMSRVI